MTAPDAALLTELAAIRAHLSVLREAISAAHLCDEAVGCPMCYRVRRLCELAPVDVAVHCVRAETVEQCARRVEALAATEEETARTYRELGETGTPNLRALWGMMALREAAKALREGGP